MNIYFDNSKGCFQESSRPNIETSLNYVKCQYIDFTSSCSTHVTYISLDLFVLNTISYFTWLGSFVTVPARKHFLSCHMVHLENSELWIPYIPNSARCHEVIYRCLTSTRLS